MNEVVLKNKKPNKHKLISFGFKEQNGEYIYSADLVSVQMKMTVAVNDEQKIFTEVIDDSTGEEYVLHLVESSSGAFVGQVKAEYESILDEIAEKCFETDVFKCKQTKEVISYAFEKYGDSPEYLWQKFPDNAIMRRKDTKKWYAALLTVAKRKLGIDEDGNAEILDLRIESEKLESLIDNKQYFPGYHMNKKHWYTIMLDGSVPTEEICQRIDESYMLANK